MKLPLFTTFILFVLLTQFALRRSNKREREADDAFWAREREADGTRKQPLDDLDFIRIPLDALPFGEAPGDPAVVSEEETIRALAGEEDKEWSRIVNLTGISNTDLKLRYGAANLERLIYYDQNYTSLVTALQGWGAALSKGGAYAAAEQVLTYAVSIGTDISATYALLVDLYRSHAEALGLSDTEATARIRALLPTAEGLQSLSRDRIVQLLQEALTATP